MSPLPPVQEFDPRVPIYLQIVAWVLRAIASGQLLPGEELPSRRVLAATLGINPMTVQKAFRALEEDGVLQTSPNAASSVSPAPDLAARVRSQLARSDGRDFVQKARALGMDFGDIIVLLNDLWRDEGERR